jgi:hypothetical protein
VQEFRFGPLKTVIFGSDSADPSYPAASDFPMCARFWSHQKHRSRPAGSPRQATNDELPSAAKKGATQIRSFDRVPIRLESDVSGQQELGAWTLIVHQMRAD